MGRSSAHQVLQEHQVGRVLQEKVVHRELRVHQDRMELTLVVRGHLEHQAQELVEVLALRVRLE